MRRKTAQAKKSISQTSKSKVEEKIQNEVSNIQIPFTKPPAIPQSIPPPQLPIIDSKQPIIDDIYGKTIQKISLSKKIEPDDLIKITTIVMSLAQQQIMKGEDKKKLVIDVMKKISFESHRFTETTKLHLDFFIKYQLPILIDTIVTAANNPKSIGKIAGTECC